MRRLAIAILLLSVLSVTFAAEESAASSAPAATVTVRVTSGSASGKSTEGDSVYLEIYRHEQNMTTLQGTADANGIAVFRDVPTGDHLLAVPRVKHGDMMFGGQPVAITPTRTEFAATAQVFDVSFDTSKLSVQTHHMIIKSQGALLHITEYIQLVNDSDTAVSSAERDSDNQPIVLNIELPEGFDNFQPAGYLEEGALVRTSRGFYDTMAVPPGEYQLTFSYTLDITSAEMDIVRTIAFSTVDLVIFTQLPSAELTGLGQEGSQVMGQGGAPMKYYKKSGLAPGEKVAFRITGFNVRGSDLTTWLILTLVFGAVLILALSKLRTGKA